jgi:phage terminase large subunit-like protein
MRLKDKQALLRWDKFRKQVKRSTYVDITETAGQQKKRIAKLEANDEAWFKYYFPNYYKSDAAPFHTSATKRWMESERIYEVRAWSRELAKSTRAMMEDLKLMLTGKSKFKIQVSASYDKAEALLMPYMINLESNQRIIHDYGEQKKIGQWEGGYFVTKQGFGFAAIGAGQSPRGLRLEDVRPDILDIDDIDTDEECRNQKIIKQKWDWIEQALLPTLSVSGRKRVRFNGNIIAKYCCITEAIKKADYVDVINIRDKHGKSTWPAKNSEPDIDYTLSKISYISAQKEYFNNPISQGTVFSEMHYKKMPSLSAYKFLVCYIDLSYKSTSRNDYKAAVLMGKWKDEYHVLKCFIKQGTTMDLAKGLIEIKAFVGDRCSMYWYAEENFLQDIILKELHEVFTKLKSNINIAPDKRKKPDKFTRIETALEPLNTNGKLYLNEAEQANHHMQILEEQFKALEPGTKSHDDGPDACEGAKQIIDSKFYQDTPMILGSRKPHSKRF